MADCSYSRCVQERRNIRRELQKWTKNMVYIVGLERIAEELMGRRKWKLYQECMSRNQQQPSSQVHTHPHPITNNNINNINNNNCIVDSDSNNKVSSSTTATQATTTTQETAATTTTTTTTATTIATTITTVKQEPENDEQERLKDWSPQSKCYFCVDGKLDSDHTTHGALSPRPSDSESSDSPSDSEVSPTLLNKGNKQHHHQQYQQQQLQSLGRHRGGGMTTIESVTSMASLAAVAALTGGTAVGSPGAAQVPFAYQPLFASAPWYLNSLARNIHQHQQQQQQQQQQQVTVVTQQQQLHQQQTMSVAKVNNNVSNATVSGGGSSGGLNVATITTDVEEINTKDLAQRISAELKRYSIPQAIFAQRVLCRSQGTLSDLLRNPKPWSKLKSGRETFRRMWKWLQEPEFQRMSALRLADCQVRNVNVRAVNSKRRKQPSSSCL